MRRDKQQQTVAINRGQFLIRYATAEDEERPPKVALAPDPVSTKDISFLLHPDHNEAVLWQPGACLVVTAMAAGKLCVEVIPAHEGGSAAATVRIEPLSQGKAVPHSLPTKKRGIAPSNLGDLRVLGHGLQRHLAVVGVDGLFGLAHPFAGVAVETGRSRVQRLAQELDQPPPVDPGERKRRQARLGDKIAHPARFTLCRPTDVSSTSAPLSDII